MPVLPAYGRRPVRAVLLCLAGVLSQAASAEEAPIVKVEVKGQYNKRRDDTASKTVVSRAEIVRFGNTTLLGVLKRLPAVTVIGNDICMRGLGGGYTQILVNGEKAPPGFAIESLSPDAIEKIDILRSASAELGAQAIAGIINIITRRTRSGQRELKVSLGDEERKATPDLTLRRSGREGPLSDTLVPALLQTKFATPATIEQRYTGPGGGTTRPPSTAVRARPAEPTASFTPRLNWMLANGSSINSRSLLRFMRNGAQTHEIASALSGTAPA